MGNGPQTPKGATIVRPKTEQKQKLQRPRLWKVLFHNDDFTPMEFVTWVLQTIFQRSENEANAIMLLAHRTGVAVAGVYPKEVAETKVQETQKAAEEQEFPLLVTMEPEELGDEPENK